MPDSTPHRPRLDLGSSAADLTAQLCDIESVSGNEAALADAIEEALAGLPHLELVRDGDAIVARTHLGRASRVIIAGHIDTVPVNANLPAHRAWADGVEYLWGRGTVDMKAGVAVQLRLAAELTDPVVDLTWVWYDHEEVSSELNGLGRLTRNHPGLFQADFAILGEPTGGEVEGGCNGTVRVDIKTHGLRAHSARSWTGRNAIHEAAPILGRLAEYRAREVMVDGLLYREGLNAVGIRGGIAGNVIPDECTIEVNYRFAPDKTADEAVGYLRDLFAGHDLEVTDRADGARPGLDAPIAQEFIRAVGAEAKPKYGWTDVARFSAMGIPAVNYGPGDAARAHADDERVAVSDIEVCEAALRRWLMGD